MADKTAKVPENIPGKFYVDETCTPCRNCIDVMGIDDYMKWNDDETYVFFHKQPDTPDGEAICQEALDVCPTNAIGNDGE